MQSNCIAIMNLNPSSPTQVSACGTLPPAILLLSGFHNLHTSWSLGSSQTTSPVCFPWDRTGGAFQRGSPAALGSFSPNQTESLSLRFSLTPTPSFRLSIHPGFPAQSGSCGSTVSCTVCSVRKSPSSSRDESLAYRAGSHKELLAQSS